ncbi:MAG: glycosyltransferase [Pyrinomonadaceae bacterium]
MPHSAADWLPVCPSVGDLCDIITEVGALTAIILIYFDIIIWISIVLYVCGTLVMLRGLVRETKIAHAANPFVSVVVAARNEEQRLPGLLADLSVQTYVNFEVIVVDDRSRDKTADLVRAAKRSAPHRFTLLQQTRVPAGQSPKKLALQKGIEASRGEILLLTDADCRVRPTWVERMAAHYAPDVAMVLGYSELKVARESSLFERAQAFEFLTLVAAMVGSAKMGRPLGASGQNISFRRRAFDQVGGYSSIIHRIAGDDMLMLQLMRANAQVGKIVYADDVGAYNCTYPERLGARFAISGRAGPQAARTISGRFCLHALRRECTAVEHDAVMRRFVGLGELAQLDDLGARRRI